MADEALQNGKVIVVDDIRAVTKEAMEQAKAEGQLALLCPERGKGIELTDFHSPDQILEVKAFYDTHFAEILDNPNLSEKEKFHACMMKGRSLFVYDDQAANLSNPEYKKSAVLSSRNQISLAKYGTMICVGYAGFAKVIGSTLGIDVRNVSGMIDANTYNNLPAEKQQIFQNAILNGEKTNASDHQVNIVTFSDGSSHLLDLTSDDSNRGDKDYDSKMCYMTDMENFRGTVKHDFGNGEQLLFQFPSDREIAKNCTLMPREQIAEMEKHILEEVPSLAVSQELDELQKSTQMSREKTSVLYKMQQNVKGFMDKMFGNSKQPLLAGHEYAINSNIEATLQTSEKLEKVQDVQPLQVDDVARKEEEPVIPQQNDFRAMISNNGQYRKDVEEYMKNYQSQQKGTQEQMLEQDEMER